MTPLEQSDLRRRLGYVIHRGLVEIRLLAHEADRIQEIHDLADLLEFMPRYLANPTNEDRSMICGVLQEYRQRYPNSWDLAKYLHEENVPDTY